MDKDKCYVLGLKPYQNSEFDYVDRIVNGAYSKYAVFGDVPTVVEFRSDGLNQKETILNSGSEYTHVSYCLMSQNVICELGGDDTPINMDDNIYNANLIPGWFGEISKSSLLNGMRLMYHKIDVSYKTSAKRAMPMALALAMGRTIAYDLLREIIEKFSKDYSDIDNDSNEIVLNAESSAILNKIRLSIDTIEKHYGGCIMVDSKLGRTLDKVIESSRDDAVDSINMLCGIIEPDEDDNLIVGRAMAYIQAIEARRKAPKLEIAKYFSEVDTWKEKAMDSISKVNDVNNKIIESLKHKGKLDEYKRLYREYFDKLRALAVDRAKEFETCANRVLEHVVTKEQITLEEVEALYNAAENLGKLVYKENRPKEITDILDKISELRKCSESEQINKLKDMLKYDSEHGRDNICTLNLNATKLNR